MEKGKSW